MSPDGSNRIQISKIEGGISGFKYAPDQSKILYTKDLEIEEKFPDLYEGLPLASGRLMNDLMYRHWDHWVDTYSHVFMADYDGKQLSNHKDIMEGEPFNSPLSPLEGLNKLNGVLIAK